SGSRTTNSLPRPTPSLWTSTRPPCNSASVLTSVRPMPRPSRDRSSDVSTCANMSNTRGRSAAAMPMPVSRTRITASPFSSAAISQMRPPLSGNLHALFSRLATTCVSLAASAWTNNGPGGVLDRRDRQRHGDPAAVGSHPLGLEMIDAYPGLQALDDPVFFGDALGRDDDRDMAADRLGRAIPEQPLGGRVPALDHSVQ